MIVNGNSYDAIKQKYCTDLLAYSYGNSSAGLLYTSNSDGTCYVSGIGTCTDTDIVIPDISPAGDVVASANLGVDDER